MVEQTAFGHQSSSAGRRGASCCGTSIKRSFSPNGFLDQVGVNDDGVARHDDEETCRDEEKLSFQSTSPFHFIFCERRRGMSDFLEDLTRPHQTKTQCLKAAFIPGKR